MREEKRAFSLGVVAFLLACGSCEGEPVGVVECVTSDECARGERCSDDHVCEKVITGSGGSPTVGGTGGEKGGEGGEDGGEGGAGNSAGGSAGGTRGDGGRSPKGGTAGVPGGGAGSGGSGGSAGTSGAAGGGGDGVSGRGPGGHCDRCTGDKIGNPMWEPTGAIVAVASVGEYPEPIFSWLSVFLSQYHRLYTPENVFGPSTPDHSAPYDEEMFDLLLTAGQVPRQRFTTAEYTPRSGIVLLFTIVPSDGAREGLAAEFESGPIIPNDLFPFALVCTIERDGSPVFIAPESLYPAHDTFNEPVRSDERPVDGASHLVLACPSNDSYTMVGPGSFEYVVSIEDEAGGKWLIEVPYDVDPPN